ncbi:MAG: mechanosensitive ion channel family protein [Lachnospiraceae bacterium]
MISLMQIAYALNSVDSFGDIQQNLQDAQKDLEKVNPGAIQRFLETATPKLISFGIQVAISIVVFIVCSKLINLVRKILHKTLNNMGAEHGVKTFLDSLVKVGLYFILIVSIATHFGLKTTTVVAAVGSAGLTLGLALQGSLANFAGGVLILVLKPFRVGDYIIEGSNEGVVQEITIFYTKLTTVDNRMIVIPNGNLSNNSLVNVTNQPDRMVQLRVGISYDADIKTAKKVLENVLTKEPERLQEKEIKVYVEELADSAVVIGARVWVKTEAYWEAKWRLTEAIKLEFDQAGIEIPYPQMVVSKKG